MAALASFSVSHENGQCPENLNRSPLLIRPSYLQENQSRFRGVFVSERGEKTLEKNVKWAEFDV